MNSGRGALDPVVTAYGESYFDKPRGSGMRDRLSTPDHLVEVLTTAGIDLDFASAADETAWDEMIDAEGRSPCLARAETLVRQSFRLERTVFHSSGR